MGEISEIENKKNALALLDELFQSVSPSCYKYVYLGLLEHQYPIPLIIRSRIYLDAMARKRIKNDAAFCSFVAYHHLRTTDSYLAKDLIHSIVNVLTPYFNSPWLDILKALGREDSNATGVMARHCDELAAEYEALPRSAHILTSILMRSLVGAEVSENSLIVFRGGICSSYAVSKMPIKGIDALSSETAPL